MIETKKNFMTPTYLDVPAVITEHDSQEVLRDQRISFNAFTSDEEIFGNSPEAA